MSRTLHVEGASAIVTIDQTRLPFETIELRLTDAAQCHHAIRSMAVRGAPLIGAVAAYGMAFSLRDEAGDDALARAFDGLAAARPTAVNLVWALERVRQAVAYLPERERAQAAWIEAGRICDEDETCNAAIGAHGTRLLRALPAASAGRPLQILTHCNAGRIATVAYGTALAPVYTLHEAGVPVHVWVDETRPRNQGASLTAWELAQAGVPHTVIADNAGGLLMRQGQVDAVITGCDRVAANGDVANKIGTYLKALAARDNEIPFWVACPVSTIDPYTAEGGSIEIEYRSEDEVVFVQGQLDDGRTARVRVVPDGSPALNPAFDVTPARLVSALVTERGVVEASARGLRSIGVDASLRSSSDGRRR
ncbi:MAG: hypothetical protein RL322_776 [Pseudomonadota bacterium]|jgi:methylthioribose-1-phosphate isomerase